MFKKTKMSISMLAALLFATLMVMTASAAVKTDIDILINGKEQVIPADMGTVFIDNQARTQVPLRFISEKLGHKVVWDQKKQEVTIDDKVVLVKIGDKNIKVNGKTVVMDTAPLVIDGRTYVPVRFIAEGLGHTVDYKYISGRNCILITKSGNASDETPGQPPVGDEDGEVGVEYRPGDTPTYKWPETQYGYNETTKHWVDSQSVGSNLDNTKTREPGTMIIKDLEYLNTLVGRFGYGFAGDGQLTIGNDKTHLHTQRGNSETSVAIGRSTTTDARSVGISGWIPKSNTDPAESHIVQNNIAIESIKYFSKSIDDGHAIIAYFSKFVDKSQYPPFGKEMMFGSTKVRFEKISYTWGFNIIFPNS